MKRNLTLMGRLRGGPPVGAGDRPGPVVVRFEPEAGLPPSDAPCVRIFVGTESAQFRAERVFLWSLDRVRDRTRRYEVTLLKDLASVDRSGWKTGFEGCRALVPDAAGNTGRAIYADVSMVWAADPAELFDRDLDGHGSLVQDDAETGTLSLIDLDATTSSTAALDARWSLRDAAAAVGFGSLDTQPWRPFPSEVRYGEHRFAALWRDLEKEADAAGHTVFTRDAPSDRYLELVELYRSAHEDPNTGKKKRKPFRGVSLAPHIERIGALIEATGARTVLDYGSGKGGAYVDAPDHPPGSRHKRLEAWGDVAVTLFDPGVPEFAGPYGDAYDGVIATDVLEHIPEEDIQWVLEEFFSHARQFVFAVATCFPAKKTLPNGENAHCTVRPPSWWRGQMQMASRRHPRVRWTLCAKIRSHWALHKRKGPLKKGVRRIHHSD